MMFNAVIDAPFGKVGIRTDAAVVREIVYLPESVGSVAPDSPLAERAVEQIERYFERASARFDLPLAPVGSAFQQRVWDVISDIPPGTVLTYGQVAKRIGSARARSGRRAARTTFRS
jgi:methylated-DNA-[protein]-cysteine S-methyltransferase